MEPLVFDIGANVTRIGFSGETEPLCCQISSISPQLLPASSPTSSRASSASSPSRRNLATQQHRSPYPIYAYASRVKPPKSGGKHCIDDWGATEVIFKQGFDAVKVGENTAKAYGLLLTEPVLNSNSCRERMFEMLFETFNIPRLHLGMSAALSLFATGRVTGCVLESGYDVTSVVPIHSGYCIPEGILQGYIGGRDVTERLSDLLVEQRGFEYSSSSSSRNPAAEHFALVDKMKRENCTVCKSQEIALFDSTGGETLSSFTLPDGKTLRMGSELSRCAEVLFTTDVTALDGTTRYKCGRDVLGFNRGIQGLVRQSFHSTPESLQWCTFQDIVLCGGNTLLPGFATRLCKELENEVLYLRRSPPPPTNSIASDGDGNHSLNNVLSQARRSVVSLPAVPVKGMRCRYYDHLFQSQTKKMTPSKPVTPPPPSSAGKGKSQSPVQLAVVDQQQQQQQQQHREQVSAEISAWLGGSIIASQSSFQHLWTLKSEYEEYGNSIIDKHYSPAI